MTKEQNKILTWLLSKPGYLKKGVQTAYVLYPEKLVAFSDFEKAFHEAKSRNKKVKSISKVYANIPTIEKDHSKLSIVKNYNKNNNVLVIGDTHLPFEIEGYLDFCLKLEKDYQCSKIIHIGDLIDNHAVSFHDHDPDGRSPGDEYKLALDKCEDWYKAFPNVKICIGNHDRLPFRKAFTAGLPKNWLKNYQEMFNSPNTWRWDFIHKEFGVIYQHGTGMSGEMASVNAARENRQSTVIGHLHTVCNTRFLASEKDLIFGMSVGCGIDHHKYAFAYGKENTRKPVISAGIVIDGKYPINIPMLIK